MVVKQKVLDLREWLCRVLGSVKDWQKTVVSFLSFALFLAAVAGLILLVRCVSEKPDSEPQNAMGHLIWLRN